MHCEGRVAVASDAGTGQGSTAQRSAAKRGPGRAPAQREGSRWFMYDTERVAANLPDDARAAGLIVALSAALGCAEYIERSSDSVCNQVHGSAKRRVLI